MLCTVKDLSKPEFLSELEMRYIGGKKPYELINPLVFYTAKYKGIWVAPAGFKTDLASVPRILQNIFRRDGPYAHAAVMHDAAYEGRLVLSDYVTPVRLIKSLADGLFREAMDAKDVGSLAKNLTHAMVRIFGQKAQKP